MRLSRRGLGKAQPSFIFLLVLLLAISARVAAEPADAKSTSSTTDAAQTTADPSTTTSSVTSTSSSSSSTSTTKSTSSTTSSSSTTSTTMSTTSTTSSSSSSSTSTTSGSTTSSVSTTTDSTSSSSTSTSGPVVTVPPTANAPYMQTTNVPEGTVFIAVGAILGLIGLAVLAWRGMVAWSVNRSVRRAALAQTSDKKRLARRGGGRKRSHGVYAATAGNDVSLDKLGAATRASYKPSKRGPSTNSGLFFSPTAGGAGSHHSLNNAGNRGSSYLPAGYYAAAGTSTPVRDASGSQTNIYSPTAGLSSPTAFHAGSSPSLPAVGSYPEMPHTRHSHLGASTSSLNLSQAPQGRAPSAYLEDLFESHTSPRHSESGLGRQPDSGRR
ncbi:hypothetical protein PoHVEF18_006499 [Penicillium ochrochloron]